MADGNPAIHRTQALRVPLGQPCLVELIGDAPGRTYPLVRALVIGRHARADVVVTGSDASREHAMVRIEDDGAVMLSDLGSRNGTQVAGRAVTTHRLVDGDQIRVGASALFLFTRREEIDQRLLQSRKLASLGQMASGVAHDLNNLLGAVLSNADFINMLPSQEAIGTTEVREALDDIRGAAARAVELAGQMLDFARVSAADARPIELARLVQDGLRLLGRTMPSSVKLTVETKPGLRLLGNRSQLSLVLLNLALNARDAMPDGGRLTVSTRESVISGPSAQAHGLAAPGTYAEVAVADTGIGMPPDVVEQIFEPFFTTKAGTGGTGLGLSMVHAIVRQHGGAIHVESRPGVGTTFRILLPCDRGLHPVDVLHTTRRARPAVALRLLVIDPDLRFRTGLARALRQAGVRLEPVATLEEAFVQMQKGFKPQVILVDCEALGAEAGDDVKGLGLVASGGLVITMSATVPPGLEAPHLAKPFALDELMAMALDAPT